MAFQQVLANFLTMVIPVLSNLCSQINQDKDFENGTNLQPRDEYPSISNLDDFVKIYSSQNCLVILDNFQGIDIPLRHPVVTREIVKVVTDDKHRDRPFDCVFGPLSLTPNLTNSAVTETECPFSKFFAWKQPKSDQKAAICYKLSIPDFWQHTKPWTCLVHFELFPPQYYYDLYDRLKWHEHYQGKVSDFRFILPSTTSYPIQIIIPHLFPFHEESFSKTILQLASRLFQKYIKRFIYCREVFIFANVKISNSAALLTAKMAKIKMSRLIRLCREWEEEYLALLDVRPLVTSKLSKLTDLLFPPPTYNFIWQIFSETFADGVIPHMTKFLAESLKPLRDSKIEMNEVDTLANAYAHVWLFIMGNFTIKYQEGDVVCSSWRIPSDKPFIGEHLYIEFSVYIKGLQYFPYFVYGDWNRLMFLTCSQKDTSSIPFEELISVFDKWIWLNILTSVMGLIISLRSLPEKLRSDRGHWLSPLKVLLEQGNPFMESFTIYDRSKLLLGSYMLAGIVLSNAYKNSNVYNMILPRAPIPYKYFKELFYDNFTIFTRIVQLGPSTSPWEPDSNSQVYQGLHKRVYIEGYSEILALVRSIGSTVANMYLGQYYYSQWYLTTIANSMSDIAKWDLWSHSTIHGSISKLLEDVPWIGRLEVLERSPVTYMRKLRDMVAPQLKLNQIGILGNELVRCPKVAVILPEYICRNLSRILKVEGKFSSPYVGKESISDVDWLVTLEGLVPPHVPKAVKAAHESGLWMRWSKLFNISDSEAAIPPVMAATMNGNVILIFVVLVFGLILAFAGYLLEYLKLAIICGGG